MSARRRFWIAFATSWVVVPLAAAAIGGRLTWGHWGRPPSSDRTLESIAAVQRFSKMSSDEVFGSGVRAVRDAAARENATPGESPHGRLPAAMLRRGLLPASDDAVPTALLDEVRAALATHGLLAPGEPGDPRATELRGDVGEAVGEHGESLVVAALNGGEVSNDHYPYYEARFRRTPDGLVVESFQHYWYDAAGIEGFAHILFGMLGLLGTVVFWILFCGLLLAARLRRRFTRDRTARSAA